MEIANISVCEYIEKLNDLRKLDFIMIEDLPKFIHSNIKSLTNEIVFTKNEYEKLANKLIYEPLPIFILWLIDIHNSDEEIGKIFL